MKRLFRTLGRNSIIFLGSIFFSLILLYVIKNPDIFQSSVLQLSEIETIKKNKWDLAYKTTGNVVDIFIDDTIQHISGLQLTLGYSPDTILSLTGCFSQGAYEILSSDNQSTIISINQFTTIDPTQSIVIIPFSGDMNQILVEEASAILPDTTIQPLAIGSLSEKTTH